MKYEITRFSCFLEFHIEQKWELYGNVMLVGISYPVILNGETVQCTVIPHALLYSRWPLGVSI